MAKQAAQILASVLTPGSGKTELNTRSILRALCRHYNPPDFNAQIAKRRGRHRW